MNVFITGLTGTLGTQLAKLHHSIGDRVYGCARSESKAVKWLQQYSDLATLFVGDARLLDCNKSDMGRILPHINKLYHCAAMKHVDICEKQSIQAVSENIELTQAVSCVCSNAQIPMTFISSDKACLPQGVYGATKLIAEQIAIKDGATAVRFGNIIGSSGSVFHLWKTGSIKVTDSRMTRYFISVQDAARFAASWFVPGKVIVPKDMLSVEMGEIAREFSTDYLETGARAGETLHQWLIAPREPYLQREGFLELNKDGYVDHPGLCSHTAPRWDTKSLMEIINA